MPRYNWQQKDWPDFKYSLKEVEEDLFLFAEKAGKVGGIVNALPEDIQINALVEIMVSEAIKTSEIEGEYLSRKDVMSSIRKNLGLVTDAKHILDKKAIGISELMIDVRRTFKDTLTEEKIFVWHRLLFKGRKNITIGNWRKHMEPMQVVSGALGEEKVHFEAPPSDKIPLEMTRFIQWFNDTAPGGKSEIKKAALRSALAHLYFETIHPFEDGNGRIGRAIAEKALSQGLGRPVLLSLSKTIEANKQDYYAALQRAQTSNQVTGWVEYFIRAILTAQTEAEELIEFTLQKVKFFNRFNDKISERQKKVILRMFEEGPKDFHGGMNASNYSSITKISKATATRDLQELLEIGAFIPFGAKGGRSTSYQINTSSLPTGSHTPNSLTSPATEF